MTPFEEKILRDWGVAFQLAEWLRGVLNAQTQTNQDVMMALLLTYHAAVLGMAGEPPPEVRLLNVVTSQVVAMMVLHGPEVADEPEWADKGKVH